MAVMRAAYGEGPPTWNLIMGSLCERFHKLPEEIEGCDIVRLLQMVDELEVFQSIKKLQTGQSLTEGESELVAELLRADLEQQKNANV